MATQRYLIVNADDFGLSSGVNRGIIEAHKHGIVTSTSLMVRWPAAAEAAAYSREHTGLSFGLHVDLGEWAYRDGTWVALYEVVPVDDITAVRDEVSRQLATFRRYLGTDPTHIDSHQHVHRGDPVRSALVEVSHKLGVPLRHCCPEVRYCGDFYGQTAEGSPLPDFISINRIIKILEALPPGITELACHPGYGANLDTMYRSERDQEVEVLCHPQVWETIVTLGIELRSFRTFQ